MRLDKFLAMAGIGKRKEAREYIQAGEVTVNEKIIDIPAIEIDEEKDIILYKGKRIEKEENKYYMLNKPKGYITAKSDDKEETVFKIFKEEEKKGLFHVGRLDKDTEGLLLFTNDGEFEHKIMHPNKEIKKTYLLLALGKIDEEKIKLLEEGVSIGQKEEKITEKAEFKLLKKGKYKEFKKEINADVYEEEEVFLGELTITEGKKHQVKRMIRAIGGYVVYLKRVKIGNLRLDESLELGSYRELSEEERGLIYN
ncbi:MAG: pseudouridine synthase [Clostridium sp.]|uniref:pseudouridine synthase n=1 Tax=Clostridium sp. TaxID=1506 RepID=UPI003F3C8106